MKEDKEGALIIGLLLLWLGFLIVNLIGIYSIG